MRLVYEKPRKTGWFIAVLLPMAKSFLAGSKSVFITKGDIHPCEYIRALKNDYGINTKASAVHKDGRLTGYKLIQE